MTKEFYVDHHIQSSILGVLMHEGPRSFSSLKPGDLENSLFMYHMRKLLVRGIVEKRDGNFELTPEGVRWINKTGLGNKEVEGPRCLVQLLVLKNDQILLSERLDHIAEHLNRFVIPGGLHKFGQTSLESVQNVAKNIGIESVGELITQVELIIPDNSHHSITDIYLADVDSDEFEFSDEFYKVSFIKIDEVINMSQEEASVIPQILKKYHDKNLKFREEFIL